MRVLQWEPQCKGLDDFIAVKAGVDLEKQRVELDTLTATVSELPATKAAETWIIPQYRCLFEREIMAISPHMDQRSMLADQIFKALGTTAGDLKRGWRETTKPANAASAEVIVEDIEPWPEPVVPAEVGRLLLARWHSHLVTSNVNYWALSLWQILTHLKDRLSLMPQLGICSALKRCGKTRTLEVLERTVWKGLLAASVSPAATIRTIEKYEPCFLIDEFDAFLKENEEFRGVLNTCHSRGIKHIRCQPETHEPQAFNAFCAVAIALIGELPSTVEDRAIVIYLKRKQSAQLVLPVRKVPAEVFVEERRKIRRFALDYGTDILRAIPVLPRLSNDRALENWEPLAQIAQILGDDWPKRAFLCAKTLTPSDSDDRSFTIQLLVSLRGLFKARGLDRPGHEEEVLPTNVITTELNKDAEAPWADRKQYFAGLTAEKLGFELRRFKVHRRRDNRKSGRPTGYCWKDLGPIFIENLGDDDGDPPPPPDPPDPPPQGAPDIPVSEKNPQSGNGLWHCGTNSLSISKSTSSECHSPESIPAIITDRGTGLTPLGSDTSEDSCHGATVGLGDTHVFLKEIPPSTPQSGFCTPSNPDRLISLDTETFYPWDPDYPQPEAPPGTLLRRQNKGLAHPWAKDPRRCALRFLTVHDTEGTFGSDPLTIDLQTTPELPSDIQQALATSTLVGHNLDFDITVLRRYGITCSSSIIDTMTASRLLGLGKEKFKVPPEASCDLDPEELEAMVEADSNPIDHSLAAVVKRYLGIKMDKAKTNLGGSDWGRAELSKDHYRYMKEDVRHLPALWAAIETELHGAHLDEVFHERMQFAVHLNTIKMTGNPVDPFQIESDRQNVLTQKDGIREELREMFADYSHPIPKSRRKSVVTVESGKIKRSPGPTHEEFHASNRNHWVPALALHGIQVENTQAPTLRKIDAPECKLLLRYADTKKRLDAINGIVRSLFPDGRARASGWNQLAARTGRITSTEPNLQQVPRDWRTGFRVDPPQLWLKGDLSQIEVVILAAVTGDQNLIRMLQAGQDVYVEVASQVFGVEARRSEEEGCVTNKLRDVSKVIVLGTSYGLTIYGFVRQIRDELGIEFTYDEAERFFQEFFGMFPAIEGYHTRAWEDSLTVESIRTARGTRRYLPALLDDGDGNGHWPSREFRKRVLLNTPIQGGGADLQIRAVNKFMGSLPAGVETVNLVHDEVDLILPSDSILHPTMTAIRSAFQEAFAELYRTVLVPQIKFSLGPSWGETKPIIEDA